MNTNETKEIEITKAYNQYATSIANSKSGYTALQANVTLTATLTAITAKYN